MDSIRAYQALIIGICFLAGIMALNIFIYRRVWKSYPTQAQYRAAHPGAGANCHRCGNRPAKLSVSGRGKIYRCTWCETELYRVDA